MKKLMMVLIAFACANVWASDAWYLGTWEGDYQLNEWQGDVRMRELGHGTFVLDFSPDGAVSVQWKDLLDGSSRKVSCRILGVRMVSSTDAELSFVYNDGYFGVLLLKRGKGTTFLLEKSYSSGWRDVIEGGMRQVLALSDVDWTAAHNFSGVVYDAGENCVGMIQIATKKATKKGVGVSGTMMLQDGKKITLKNMTVAPEGGVLNVAWTVKGYGKLNVAIGAEGFSGQFEDGGSVESQELDENTGVLKASITMTYIDKKTGKMKTKKITFGGFVSGGEGVGTVQASKKDPIKDVEFTVR